MGLYKNMLPSGKDPKARKKEQNAWRIEALDSEMVAGLIRDLDEDDCYEYSLALVEPRAEGDTDPCGNDIGPVRGFKYPDNPTIEPVIQLYRPFEVQEGEWNKRAICICKRGPGGSMNDFGSIGVGELQSVWPSLSPKIQFRSYATINARLLGQGFRNQWHEFSSFCRPTRKAKHVSTLNCVTVDLDFYSASKRTAQEVWDLVVARSENLGIPVSLGIHGKGLWAYWFLRTPESDHPPELNYSTKRCWNACQKAIHALFADLGADFNCELDPSRLFRIPGSVHEGINRRVGFFIPAGIPQPQSYTLSELDLALGVPKKRAGRRRRLNPVRNPVDPAKRMSARLGYQVRHLQTASALIELLAMRGSRSIPEGSRSATVATFACVLHMARRAAKGCLADNNECREQIRMCFSLEELGGLVGSSHNPSGFLTEMLRDHIQAPWGFNLSQVARSACRRAQTQNAFKASGEVLRTLFGMSDAEIAHLVKLKGAKWLAPGTNCSLWTSRRVQRQNALRSLLKASEGQQGVSRKKLAQDLQDLLGYRPSQRTLYRDLAALKPK